MNISHTILFVIIPITLPIVLIYIKLKNDSPKEKNNLKSFLPVYLFFGLAFAFCGYITTKYFLGRPDLMVIGMTAGVVIGQLLAYLFYVSKKDNV